MINEIRWHGRGGQGAKTVSKLLAQAMMDTGYYVQAFPEYGPERSGAPIKAYNRFSDRPIRLHCGVTEPNTVVVLDNTLLKEIDVLSGLKEDGLLIINTSKENEAIREQLQYSGQLLCIDGNGIAQYSGGGFANTVLVGTVASQIGNLPLENVLNAAKALFQKKLPAKKLEYNLEAIKAGFTWLENVSI